MKIEKTQPFVRRPFIPRASQACVAGARLLVRSVPFGVSTFFPKHLVRTEGTSKVYVHASDSGQKIAAHFCPDCGSAVFWGAELFADLIGIAFGAFADPTMRWPALSVWKRRGIPG